MGEKVTYIDEGEEKQEEAALRGLTKGFEYLLSPEGQAKAKERRAKWEKEHPDWDTKKKE